MSFSCPQCGAALTDASIASSLCPSCAHSLRICGYKLQSLLGRGGMGAVYEAVSDSGERAAVKMLSLSQGADWKAYDLFEQSAKVLQGLSHPGIPKVYAFFRSDAGKLFLVRETFDGGTLQERMRQGRRLAPEEFKALFLKLLDILEFLHSRVPPVYHRDIKPSNIMFRSADDWSPVLVDFDTVAAPEALRSGLTVVGTPGYAAPEQFAGMVSAASDLYSLGATMLYVATHVEPDSFPKQGGRFQVEHLLGSLPEETKQALLKLLEPESHQRYQSAAEVKAALQHQPPASTSEAAGASADGELVRYLVETFQKESGIDISGDQSAMKRIREAASRAGVELSSSSETEVNLPFLAANASGPKHLVVRVSREALARHARQEAPLAPHRVTSDIQEQVKHLIQRGDRIGAIKLHRELNKSSLSEASQAISRLEGRDQTLSADPGRAASSGVGIVVFAVVLAGVIAVIAFIAGSDSEPPQAPYVASTTTSMGAETPIAPAVAEPPAPASDWSLIPPTSDEGYDLHSFAEFGDRIWMGGDNNSVYVAYAKSTNVHNIYRSKDSGASIMSFWTDSKSGELFALRGDGLVVRSTESGQIWKADKPTWKFAEEYRIKDVWQSAAGEILAVGEWGEVKDSAMNGMMLSLSVWGAVYRVEPNGKLTLLWHGDPALRGLFGVGNNLVAVGQSGGILLSKDKGKHWKPAESGTKSNLNAIWGVEQSLFVVGDGGVLLRSQDGGVTWSDARSGVSRDLNDIIGLDVNHLYAVGDEGLILSSEDGGDSWSTQDAGEVKTNLKKLAIADNKLFAVGDTATVLRRELPVVAQTPVNSATSSVSVLKEAPKLLRACYAKELEKNPDSQASIKASLSISEKGEVSSVSLSVVGTLSDGAKSCMELSLKKLVFPASGELTTLTTTFSFLKD